MALAPNLWAINAVITYSGLIEFIEAACTPQQEPYLSPTPVIKDAIRHRGVARIIRLLLAAASDEIRRVLQLPPVYIKLIASLSDTQSLSLLPLQDSEMATHRCASTSSGSDAAASSP